MKHLFILSLLILGFAFNGSTQPPHYDDLLIYFADGDYEKLVTKAAKYTSNDKTKRDALPYLYSSKGNYEMSKDQKYSEDFPKAFNNAIGDAGKALKKDKDGSVYGENIKYFTELKETLIHEIENMIDAEDYSRIRGKILKLQRLDKADVGSHFLLAAAQYRIKDKSSAKLTIKAALLKLDEVESVEDWREVDLLMLQIGVLEYANYLVSQQQGPKAAELLNKIKQWYEDDEVFMEKYNDIVN